MMFSVTQSQRAASHRRPAATKSVGALPASVYPVDLFDVSARVVGHVERPLDGRHWWLLHSKPRQEKKLAGELLAHRVPFYLPLVDCKTTSRGRTRHAWLPLFAGYVFLWGTSDERLQALKTNRLVALHEVADGERLRCDLANFAALIAKGAALTPESRIVPGQRVRVKAGPFAGQEGMVLKRHGKTRLLVTLQALLQGASLEIEDHWLESA